MIKKLNIGLLIISIVFVSCNSNKNKKTEQEPIQEDIQLLNPALPGDNPDPSVIRVGETYYATSTTNEWAPYFTIYKSTDLKNWELINHVFPNGYSDMKDQWGENNFWASELAYDAEQNKIYAYYTAHDRTVSGNPGLKIGVAWIGANQIETGKFTDNGPVIVEDQCGAIDAFEMKENGKIYAFWKNDGNGCGKETWIWMQEINESRTQLIGEKKQLYKTTEPWETALVEGACFFKKGDYYYSLYAVGGCCDFRCNYKTGIARTKNLASGNWEKYEKNPIMESNDKWMCPGHGTVVETPDGKLFMLYHAFNKDYDVFVGREGIIEELKMNEDGWPVLHNATVANRPKSDLDYSEDFTKENKINIVWQWPSKLQKPDMLFEGALKLQASNENHDLGTFLGQYVKTTNFEISSKINPTDVNAGICLSGAIFKSKWPGELGGIGISVSKTSVQAYSNLDGNYELLKQDNMPTDTAVELKLHVQNGGSEIDFFYKTENEWIHFYSSAIDVRKYAPWGMGYRVGITAKSNTGDWASFENFALVNK
tara:strand:- start:18027 stop:19646 length:1620 start_codon:yes stop_codon:yes gene_type:complete